MENTVEWNMIADAVAKLALMHRSDSDSSLRRQFEVKISGYRLTNHFSYLIEAIAIEIELGRRNQLSFWQKLKERILYGR